MIYNKIKITIAKPGYVTVTSINAGLMCSWFVSHFNILLERENSLSHQQTQDDISVIRTAVLTTTPNPTTRVLQIIRYYKSIYQSIFSIQNYYNY